MRGSSGTVDVGADLGARVFDHETHAAELAAVHQVGRTSRPRSPAPSGMPSILITPRQVRMTDTDARTLPA